MESNEEICIHVLSTTRERPGKASFKYCRLATNQSMLTISPAAPSKAISRSEGKQIGSQTFTMNICR